MMIYVEEQYLKIKNRRTPLFWAACVAALMATAAVQAASVSYFLDQSNALQGGINYLQVTLDDEGTPGAVNFTITALPALTPGSNIGIQSFAFNGNPLSTSNLLFTGTAAAGWQLANHNGSMSEFGKFSNVVTATGNHRADPLTFSIVGILGDDFSDYVALSQGHGADPVFFAAHVAGFRGCSLTSAYFGGGDITPVPVPGTAWLFGSGLIGLAAVVRLRTRYVSHDGPPRYHLTSDRATAPPGHGVVLPVHRYDFTPLLSREPPP